MKNRVYFFTGSGNSLHAAQEIARNLPSCDVVAIHNGADPAIPQGLERVGFVFPTHYWGLPAMVAAFLHNARFPKQNSTYYFAITTCAGMAGNALPQVKNCCRSMKPLWTFRFQCAWSPMPCLTMI